MAAPDQRRGRGPKREELEEQQAAIAAIKWIVVFWYLSLGQFHISLYMMRWVESEIGIFLPFCPFDSLRCR